MSAPHIASLPAVVRMHAVRVVRNALVATTIVLAGSFLIPDQFTSSTLLLPPGGDDDISGLLGGGAGTAMLSRALGLSAENKTDVYLGVLRSQTLAYKLIERFDLKRVYRRRDMEKAARVLTSHTRIMLTNEGFIRIAVTERKPALAASLANAYAEELDQFLQRVTSHGARQRREFLDHRLLAARDSLVLAENALRDYQVKHKIPVGGEALHAADGLSQLVAQKLGRELELGTLKDVSVGPNPRVIQLRSELAQIDRELARIPPATTDLARLAREAMVREKIVLVLTEENERARLLEAKNVATVDIVDSALPPLHHSQPRRLLLAVGAFLIALCASVGLYWLRDRQTLGA